LDIAMKLMHLALAVAAVCLAGCNASTSTRSTADRASDEAKIRQLDSDWVKAAATHNAAAWTAFYADDAVVLPPNEKIADNKAAIHASITDFLAMPTLHVTWKPTQLVLADAGDIAYLYGSYQLSANDKAGKPINDTGKLVEIWKKQADGQWKCVVDTWNSDLPATG